MSDPQRPRSAVHKCAGSPAATEFEFALSPAECAGECRSGHARDECRLARGKEVLGKRQLRPVWRY